MRLSDVGERNLIKICIERLSRTHKEPEYNDISYLKLREDLYITSNIEGYVAETWRLPFTSWRDCGWRACAGACSDLVAKLSRPLGAGLSIDAPRDLELETILEVIEGFSEFLSKYGLEILKLDTNESSTTSLTVYVIGVSKRRIPIAVTEKCRIFTRPVFGYTGIVFKLYYEGTLEKYENDSVVRKGIEMIRRPQLDLQILNIDASRVLASTDSSDGLGASLWTVADLSKVRIIVENLPTTTDVVEFCFQNSITPHEVVFNGGEEYVPIMFVNDQDVERELIDLGYVYVGYVEPSGYSAVIYDGDIVRYRGWEYFRGCYT
ncbi:MAG: hypothetical protein GXO23_02740 [Crenarchaeota archaeon]|nr:hypothetical protein [Thermoproteota archaeon]